MDLERKKREEEKEEEKKKRLFTPQKIARTKPPKVRPGFGRTIPPKGAPKKPPQIPTLKPDKEEEEKDLPKYIQMFRTGHYGQR